jgi:hypothetical protein
VRVTSEFIELTDRNYFTIIELRDAKDYRLVERIYRTVPSLSRILREAGGWNVEFHRELNMTDDAWRFRTRDWLLGRACDPRGSSFVARPAEHYRSLPGEYVVGTRYVVPEGTTESRIIE